jgi:predicted nuclease of predicted toxin-antitoxin system
LKPLDFPLLADENIHPDVIARLREWGKDVETVWQAGLDGHADEVILRAAHRSGRVVLTHDRDFGTLAVLQVEPFTGIVYLRPGHIESKFTVGTLEAVDGAQIAVKPPFIVVAEHSSGAVLIRVRQLPGAAANQA